MNLRIRSGIQEITRILCNLKVHYRVHKRPPTIPILSPMNQYTSPKYNFPKIHSNLVPIYVYDSLVNCSLQDSQPKCSMYPSHTPCGPHALPVSSSVALITLTILGDENKPCSSSLSSYHNPPVTSSHLGPNIHRSDLFSNTLYLCSPLNVRDKVSHPYKTTRKIKILYILIFTFLDSRKEDKGF
jgi:hypothetical protein